MSDLTFPVIDVNNNEIISIKGEKSFFFEIEGKDLSQLSVFAKNNFYNQIGSFLNNLRDDCYYKFYRLDKRNFLQSDDKGFQIPGLGTDKSNEHLTRFFKETELYSDIKIYDDRLLINTKHLRIISVIDFNDQEIDEHLIPFDLDYVLSIRRINNSKSMKILDQFRTKHYSSFLKNKRDIGSEGAYNQAEELMEGLLNQGESLFKMEMFFLVWGDSLEELNDYTNRVIDYFNTIQVKSFIEGEVFSKGKSGLTQIFNELIPGVKPRLCLREHINKTTHLQYLLPIKRSFLMDSGVQFLDQNDEAILFNPFDRNIKNRNTLVTGTSGAGKSVFVNKLVHHLIDKHPLVILDKGGSFKRLTMYHGGVELQTGFNPFQFEDPLYLREIILSVVDKNKFDKLEKGKLLNKIKEYQDVKGYKKDLMTLVAFLEKYFKGISYYFEDLKDYFIDSELSILPILYVDIDNYPKNIVSPLIIYLLEYFKNIQVREKILVFDECWSFLTNHTEFIDECFRTFRKTGAFPIAISQSIDDFNRLGGELSSSIVNNSYFKFYFPQELKESNEIDEFDIANIHSLQYEKKIFSDCYLKSSDNKYKKILRNSLSTLEYELFHTEKGEDHLLHKFINKNGIFFKTNKDVIDSYIGLKYAKDSNSFNDLSSHIWN